MNHEGGKIRHCNSRNRQGSYWYDLKGPRAGVGSGAATQEVGGD